MGIGIVLVFWAVAGIVVAGIGAATLGCAAAMLTRGVTNGRRKLIVAASLFPFVCLGWGGAVFVFQAVVNEGLLHRDLGMGDTWHAPLFERYNIIDEADLTDAASRLDTKQNAAALELSQGFGHDLGTIAANCTKTEADAQMNLETAVLLN